MLQFLPSSPYFSSGRDWVFGEGACVTSWHTVGWAVNMEPGPLGVGWLMPTKFPSFWWLPLAFSVSGLTVTASLNIPLESAHSLLT